jgi:hypothetical protein
MRPFRASAQHSPLTAAVCIRHHETGPYRRRLQRLGWAGARGDRCRAYSHRPDEDRPDLNTGEPWSEMDLFDLANSVSSETPLREIAGFLCRSRREVRDKIAELKQSGELERLVREVAAKRPE